MPPEVTEEMHRRAKRNGDPHRFSTYQQVKMNVAQQSYNYHGMKPSAEHQVNQIDRKAAQPQRSNSYSPRSSQDAPFLPERAWYDDLDAKDLEYLDRLLSPGSGDNISF